MDNIGEMFVENNSVTRHTKHIDVIYHIVQEYIEEGTVKLVFIK